MATLRTSCMLIVLFLASSTAPTTAQDWRGFPGLQIPVGDQPRSVIAGDFNGDGVTDFATTNSNSNNVSVVLGNDDGFGFAAAVSYAASVSPYHVTTGDFNSDGVTDLAIANQNSDNVSILLGNGSGGVGDGTFAAAASYPADNGARDVTTGDFNGDGITDLATCNAYRTFPNFRSSVDGLY